MIEWNLSNERFHSSVYTFHALLDNNQGNVTTLDQLKQKYK